MVRNLMMLLVVLAVIGLSGTVFAADAVIERDRRSEKIGWSLAAADDDIDATAELITELDTTYAQLAAEDDIEVGSSTLVDITQTVTIKGIKSNGKKGEEDITLTGTTFVTSTETWRYIDQAEVDIECVGTVTIRRATGDTLITSIPIGVLESSQAQHFNGEDISYITGWMAGVDTTTGNVTFELRWYPDDADSLDAADGYKVLDRIFVDGAATSPYNAPPHIFPQRIKCPAGGWLAIYGTGSAANCDGYVFVQGYDVKT